jgi:tyrosine-protein kinase Etk/Wzc
MHLDNTMEEFWQEKESDFNFKDFVFKYLRHWYWFVLGVVLCGLAAWLYLQKTAPKYKVTATILIKDEKKGGLGGMDVLKEMDMFSGSKIVDNEVEVLKSRNLLEKVADNLNLGVSYAEEGTFRDTELFDSSPIRVNTTQLNESAFETPAYVRLLDEQYFELLDEDKSVLGKFMYTQAIKSAYGTFRVFRNKDIPAVPEEVKLTFTSINKVVDDLREAITAEPISKNATVLQLGFEHSVPSKGKAILSRLLEEYSFAALEDKNREASNTLRFIEERLKLVTGELTDVEQDVERYRNVAGITDLSVESSLFLEKVKENDIKLNDVDIQINVLDGVERYVNSNQGTASAPATLMVNDPVLTQYIGSLSDLELEREKLTKGSGARASNPYLNTVNTQIENTRQAIKDNLAAQKRSLNVQRSGLRSNNSRLESAIRTIPRKEREYVGIQRQQNIKESLYLTLLQKREETALSYASTVTDSRVVDTASSTSEPISPKTKIILLGAILLGLVLPAGVIELSDMMIDTVQSRKEIEDQTGLNVFGEIGLKDKKDKGNILDSRDRGFIAEQFRTLRTNLQYLNTGGKESGITFLLTSSFSGEGKTFVSLNLASSLAALGKKVVILELDLRKPKLSSYMGVTKENGITNYLTGKLSETDIIKPTMIDNLYLVSSGPLPPNPAELLAGNKINQLIEVYQKSFDYVILDTPPIGLVADSLLLSQVTDACFYLVRHEVTQRNQLQHLKKLNEQKRFKSLNVLFNGVNYKNSKEYSYGYGGYYGYGAYGYGENEKKPWWKKLLS